MTWSEEDGEVTISPGGTKRVKRVRFDDTVSIETFTREDEVVEDDETGDARSGSHDQEDEEAAMIVEAGVPVEITGWEEDDSDLDSLFNSP